MEETARRIAELGNGALRRRLRPAFDHAAVTYASRITISGDELERMLEHAAQRADATVWRRALAGVAMDELDIGLDEALEHPAVIRAQEMVGAPPLDRAVFLTAPERKTEAMPVAELVHQPESAAPAKPETPVESDALAEAETTPASPLPLVRPPEFAASDELEAVESDALAEAEAVPESLSQPVRPAESAALAETEAVADSLSQPVRPAESAPLAEPDLAPETIRLAAVHLDGIENLPSAGKYLELRFSEAGFDVVDADGGDVIGRLRWDEIDALELPRGRSSLGRRSRHPRAQLVVRADRGEASFEIRGLTDGELREHLAPMLARVRGTRSTT